MAKKFVFLNERQVCDLEMILIGAFAPLTGFMDEEDYNNVLDNMRLKNNTLWPLPITLSVQNPKNYQKGEEKSISGVYKMQYCVHYIAHSRGSSCSNAVVYNDRINMCI